jgi:hypothetical protein
MSYNCDTFKIKKIKDLRIPLSSLHKHDRSDWHLDRINNEDGSVTFVSCEVTMNGIIEDDTFVCKKIDCSGEGSGTTMNWIIEPALKDSTGELIASCVWEGGDSINKLTVKDGNVSWEDIEI